ncbi:hypothetical protein MMC25_005665 [Agyrium rufum]|nr:hypothetical protein [Agyrium rufum]
MGDAAVQTPPRTQKEEEKDELDALDALEKEASEFNKDAEIDRILKAFKLDAYAVLDLQPGVPDSTIKAVYRKKSLLIHPDKTSNPSAPTAFDALKKAQTALMDEKQRGHLDECIADARSLLMREHKFTPDSPEMREPDKMSQELKDEWRRLTIRVLIEEEQRRRRQLKAQMQEEGREQKKVDEEIEQRKRKREFEGKWEETRDGRIGSWREFSKGMKGAGAEKSGGGGGMGMGEGKKKKKEKLKVLG